MNRRQFFSFAAVAPVALPMAAKAMAEHAPLIGGAPFRYSPGVIGEIATIAAPPSYAMDLFKAGFISRNEAIDVYGILHSDIDALRKGDADVAAQFDADLDLLFDRAPCQGDGTLESTGDTVS